MTRKGYKKQPITESSSILRFVRINNYHWLILFLSVFLTLLVWYAVRQQSNKLLNEYFDQEVEQVVELVKERMHKYELALWAGTATIKAHNDDISYQNWLDFSKMLEIEQKYPGINGIGVIHSVAPENLAAYLEEQREFRPDYKVFPEHSESEYLPVTYIEPVATNAQAVGLDMAHETNRYTAAKKARDFGLAQITGPITLVQDLEKTPGFLFYVPYYNDGKYPTVKARQKEFAGMVYAPFVVKRLMQGVLGEKHRDIQIRIFDSKEKIYDEFTDLKSSDPAYEKLVPLNFYGRNWLFDIRSNRFTGQLANKNYSTLILFGGSIITVLLFFLFQSHTRTHRRAVQFAEQMTLELQEKTEKLKRSNEDLEQFAYVASHDLQEPLRVIGNFTQLLQRRYQGEIDEKADVYIGHTVDGVKQMQKLLIDLLDYARVTSIDCEFEKTDINVVLEGVLRDLAISINESNVTIEVDSLPTVLGEKTQLHQLFQNLLSNALKFRVQDRDLQINIRVKSLGDKWCFTVEDNGIGMEKTYLKKIFVMFQRLNKRSQYTGSGVGLAICKKVVLSHGGEIWAESTLGEGTSFIFTLPK